VVALTAALIPPLAEATWGAGGRLKAVLWWIALVPAATVVFFSAGIGSRHRQIGFSLGEFCLGTSCSTAKSTALGLR
jgi:hypothetical protein